MASNMEALGFLNLTTFFGQVIYSKPAFLLKGLLNWGQELPNSGYYFFSSIGRPN